MHPIKAHQSTTKDADTGLRLGFVDIEKNGDNLPSGVTQQTPSKIGNSSAFDFHFARPGPPLGPEAQKLMDDLREEALRIKAKLATQREEEKRLEERVDVSGRKIALPKGKVGRYSDVHMAEFKKMDSITGHASSFRAQPGRIAPAATPSLKRSQSKAKLDDKDEDGSRQKRKMEESTGRLENSAPAKRAGQNMIDDTSSARPGLGGNCTPKTMPSTPTLVRSQCKMVPSITTPTQASLARAANTKNLPTQIPTLTKSSSKSNLAAIPRGGQTRTHGMRSIDNVPRSEPKMLFSSPGRLDRFKSMLRYPSSSKKSSVAPSSIPSLVTKPVKPNLEKTLPSISTMPGLERSKSVKHVNFTPDIVTKNASLIPNSPFPIKSAIPRSAHQLKLATKAQPTDLAIVASAPAEDVHYPAVAGLHMVLDEPRAVEYPSLAGFNPLDEPPRRTPSEHDFPASVPGMFTFRSDHTIQFGDSPRGFGSSPGQSSIRQVRQSIFANNMPGTFPTSNGSNKENNAPKASYPFVPHETSNKKRRRAGSEDEGEKDVEGSPSKKQKANVPEVQMLKAPKLLDNDISATSKTPSPAKKKVLSMSRLNMLARPKHRK